MLAAASVLAEAPASELVRYGFDEEVETGPDTLRVFQNARGSVGLSSSFRISGYRSVEIRDVAHDGDFPELLGSFPRRSEGKLFAHFGLLVTDVDQTFNVALAGPERFVLKKDGIGFWLQGRGGSLYHVSDSIPKRLFSLRPFVWYTVDVGYDVGAGTYDLTIQEEDARTPRVSLRAQPNAASQPGSSVEVFSFVGDVEDDESNVVYYVDDVLLSADRPVDLAPFAAPGRRKLFIDAWQENQRRLLAGPACPALASPADLGLDARDLAGAAGDALGRMLRGQVDRTAPQPAPLSAVAEWVSGCQSLHDGKPDAALRAFGRAESMWPRGRIYPLSRAVALARAKRPAEADRLLESVRGLFKDDLRLELAHAMVGLARDDLDAALRILAPPAEGLPIELGREVEQVAEEYFLVLLWRGEYARARDYAAAIEGRFHEMQLPAGRWAERLGDAEFFGGNVKAALGSYREALKVAGDRTLLHEKLADACFRLGDVEQERLWREKVYGSLRQR